MPAAVDKKRTMETDMQYREATVLKDTVDKEKRTVELSFSSEAFVLRDYMFELVYEVLDHTEDSVRLERLNNKGPLLDTHNIREQIGVVEKAWVEDGKGKALVRFSRNKKADEVFQDVIDGIKANVSVGYNIYTLERDGTKDNLAVYRALDWEPGEISMMSIAADTSVGVGREKETKVQTKIIEKGEEDMPVENTNNQQRANEPVNNGVQTPTVDVEKERSDIRQEEAKRVREIYAIAERFGEHDMAKKYIDDGRSHSAFAAAVLEKVGTGESQVAQNRSAVEMNEQEEKRYSVLNALRLATFGGDGFEREIHDEITKKVGRESRGIYIPLNLRAALTTGTSTGAATGGYTVDDDIGQLIDLLRNKMMVRQLGARVLSGLDGNVGFPRQTASASLYWTGENPGSDVAESNIALDQVNLSPKTAQATTAVTRQLLQQSSLDVEQMLREDLASIAALGLDLAAINGSGTANQPAGILNTSGVEIVTLGTDGGNPTHGTFVDLETKVSTGNADLGSLAYLTNSKVRGYCKKTPINSTYGDKMIWDSGNEVNGYKAAVSNQVPDNLEKGASGTVCSAILYGNWQDLLIGEWGVLEIITDPYSMKKQGLIELTSIMMADIAVRHPESFAAVKDALTS